MSGRIFGLDAQLVFDVILQGICVLILFAFLSYVLFNPVRKILNDRKEKIKMDIASAADEKTQADQYRTEYEQKLANINKEAENILSEARKKAMRREETIVAEAKEEAAKIIERANVEIQLEKKKVKDEVKHEMIEIAALMASKIVAEAIDANKQNMLIEDTLKEMGDDTWLS